MDAVAEPCSGRLENYQQEKIFTTVYAIHVSRGNFSRQPQFVDFCYNLLILVEGNISSRSITKMAKYCYNHQKSYEYLPLKRYMVITRIENGKRQANGLPESGTETRYTKGRLNKTNCIPKQMWRCIFTFTLDHPYFVSLLSGMPSLALSFL